MQFITTGNRIAVENFTIGDLYTITFTNGNYINSACIGIGANFVTFQRNEPELLFSLTMETAELVSTIDLYAGGSGTNNYNELTNKPQINSVELVGNKSLAALGIQPEITEESPLSSELVSGLGSAAAAETSDFATAAQGALAASAVQPADMTAALALKQDALSSAQLAAVNSGITSADVAQITTNKNNISIVDISDKITAASGYTINSLTKLYMQGSHVFGHLIVSKNDGNFGGAQETIARFSNGYRPRDVQAQGCFFGTTEYNAQYTGYAYIQLASASSGQGSVIVKGYQTDVGTVANIHVDFIV